MFDASDEERTPDWIGPSRRFLAYLTSDGEGELGELQQLLRPLIAVAEAIDLPEPTSESPSAIEGPSLEFWGEQVRRRFPFLNIDFGEYRLGDETHFAFDDLVDIAKDLGDTVAQHEAGEPDALWEWKFGFDVHWGEIHAIPLLQRLTGLA